MNLSEKTVNLLKNFSAINQSILFKRGNTLRTMSVMKNILAEADIEDEIPQDFAIYDLTRFLNGISLFEEPELDFQNDSHLTIRDGKSKRTKDFFADPSVIVAPPEKSIELPTEDVTFSLDSNNLIDLLKASAVYGLPDLSAVGEAGVVKLVLRDKKNDTSDDFSIIVGETDKKFSFNFKIENIKILPGTYKVDISEKLLSRFVNETYDVTYYIALEPDSTFG